MKLHILIESYGGNVERVMEVTHDEEYAEEIYSKYYRELLGTDDRRIIADYDADTSEEILTPCEIDVNPLTIARAALQALPQHPLLIRAIDHLAFKEMFE